MVIAVNTRFLLSDYLEGYGNFTYETFRILTQRFPEHTFLFIFDRPYNSKFVWSPNIIPLILSPQARHPILWWIWYNIRVPAVLRKHKADVFISADGCCSLYTKVPQCIVVHDLAFLHFPKFIYKSHYVYSKWLTPLFVRKAKKVVTVSEFSRRDILEQYKIAPEKVDVVYNGVSEQFLPLDYDERERIKEKYASGNEYFLFTGAIHPRKNLVNLLKAFSIFKKKQKSRMQLLIVGRLAWQHETFTGLLNTFRFKDDVKMMGYIDKALLLKITGAAYALVYPSFFEGFGVPPLEAMRCHVPVLASNTSSIPEIGGDAILYFDPNDHHDIANKMIQIFKDENLRQDYISKGIERAKLYSWDRTSTLFWESIMSSIKG